MNTCNYLTPFPLATHEEGGVLYSNGVQVVTISNPYMTIQQDSVLGTTIMLLVGVIGGLVILGSVISWFIFKK